MNVQSRRTPYNDDYPSCLETRAALLIYTGTLPPDAVTAALTVPPSEVHVAGYTQVSDYGRERVARTSRWQLSSEGKVESRDIRRHLDWLMAQIQHAHAELLALQELQGVVMSVNCSWYSRSGSGGPTLWPEQMAKLAALNLECSFDIYFLSDD